MRNLGAALIAATLGLCGCASPYFVHDPQVGFFSREQLPSFLKSLRCELATYAAANNQRRIIHTAYVNLLNDPDTAIQRYPFFELDPAKFGGLALDLRIQDTIGTQSGTSFDWKRTRPDKIHTHAWKIAPILSDQSTYSALLGFIMPQDIYGLATVDGARSYGTPTTTDEAGKPYLCFNEIPLRDPAVIRSSYFNAQYAEQDLDAISAGLYPAFEQFTRVRVNGVTPLARWLQDTSTTVSSTSLVKSVAEQNEHMVGGQMTYTFTIQVTAGIDVKYSIASTIWTAVGGEGLASTQHTSTLTLVLNGQDSATTAGVRTGSSVRVSVKEVGTETEVKLKYCPLPRITEKPYREPGADYDTWCKWRPSLPQVSARKSNEQIPPNAKILSGRGLNLPKFEPDYLKSTRPRGTVIYPLVPLGPLGGANQ